MIMMLSTGPVTVTSHLSSVSAGDSKTQDSAWILSMSTVVISVTGDTDSVPLDWLQLLLISISLLIFILNKSNQ